MAKNWEHLQHMFFFLFSEKQNVSQNKRSYVVCMIKVALTIDKWFKKLLKNNSNLSDVPGYRKQTDANWNKISELIESDQHKTIVEIWGFLRIKHSTASRWFFGFEVVTNTDVWMTHDLVEKKVIDQISAYDSLSDPFSNRMGTEDVKRWCIIMLSVGYYGLSSDMSFQAEQKSTYIPKRFLYTCGGTGRE